MSFWAWPPIPETVFVSRRIIKNPLSEHDLSVQEPEVLRSRRSTDPHVTAPPRCSNAWPTELHSLDLRSPRNAHIPSPEQRYRPGLTHQDHDQRWMSSRSPSLQGQLSDAQTSSRITRGRRPRTLGWEVRPRPSRIMAPPLSYCNKCSVSVPVPGRTARTH